MAIGADVETYQMYIAGESRGSADETLIEDIDPATGQVFAVVAAGKARDIADAVGAAKLAFSDGRWAELAPAARGRVLGRIAELLQRDIERLASVEGRDTGKPIGQARADVAGAARYFEFYAGMADKLNGESIPLGRESVDYTVREPIGVSAQIVPWNFPLQMTSRGVAPALAAGCSVVIKPSSVAPLTPLLLAALATEAGLPHGVLNVVPGHGEEAGVALASHRDIDQLTFTGSLEAGALAARLALDNVVPAVLELGGKAPNIVFADADLDRVEEGVMRASFLNAGQSCTAGSRLLVHRDIKAQLIDRLTHLTSKLALGPSGDDPDIGPLVSEKQLERVSAFVGRAQKEGARIVTGGGRATDSRLASGYFYQPTILDHVLPDMEIAREEVFGPVLSVLTFGTEAEAVAMANDTEYGLVAAVWTREIDRALRVAKAIQSGQVFVNTWGAGPVESPFGGYKHSGFGREKGFEGIRSYLQVKNICVRISDAPEH